MEWPRMNFLGIRVLLHKAVFFQDVQETIDR